MPPSINSSFSWSTIKRVKTTLFITFYIVFSASLIGFGLFQESKKRGMIKPSLNKDLLWQELIQDQAFINTLSIKAKQKRCNNPEKQFSLSYNYIFHPSQLVGSSACEHFSAVLPDGTNTQIAIVSASLPRSLLIDQYSRLFNSVNVTLLSGTNYQTSVIMGISNQLNTTIYIVGTTLNQSYVIHYAPTHPIIDSKVEELVKSIQPI